MFVLFPFPCNFRKCANYKASWNKSWYIFQSIICCNKNPVSVLNHGCCVLSEDLSNFLPNLWSCSLPAHFSIYSPLQKPSGSQLSVSHMLKVSFFSPSYKNLRLIKISLNIELGWLKYKAFSLWKKKWNNFSDFQQLVSPTLLFKKTPNNQKAFQFSFVFPPYFFCILCILFLPQLECIDKDKIM